jgi:hypothetical protein
MARRRTYVGKLDSILPEPKIKEEPLTHERRYITLPEDLHQELKEEAARRGYRIREFVCAILRKALDQS